MDAPVWSNDLLYLKEMVLTMVITAGLTWLCFYYSRKADRRRAARVAHGLPVSHPANSAEKPTGQEKP
jgi:hypothetical protein